MKIMPSVLAVSLIVLISWTLAGTPEQLPTEVTTPATIDPEGIGQGKLIIQGGGSTPQALSDLFLKLSGGENTRLVIIPTASAEAEKPTGWVERWKKLGISDITILHTRQRNKANEETFVNPLRRATAVWISGGDQRRLSETYAGTLVEKELQAVLKRGGVIWGTSAGAAIMSKLMIAGGTAQQADLARGLDLLPGVVIDQHFIARKREPRLLGVLKRHPSHVGIGIDEGTALIVLGRTISVLGDSTATILVQGNSDQPLKRMVLKNQAVSDLTTWRRMAWQRQEPARVQPVIRKPIVPTGSLVIVGGGGLPKEIVDRFIELAGGKDRKYIVLPVSMPDPIPAGSGQFLKRAGVKDVHILPGRSRDAVCDPKVLGLLDEAHAVWFDGGRQWRFIDAYEGTPFLEKIYGVLKRGGVIGGSSAGATIQGDYLCRGNPLGPQDMMCEGYEKGFAFLPGVGIDQHFTQRNRFKDMFRFKKSFPQYLGIGIDEATALVVQGHQAEIIGKNRVCFYPHEPRDETDFISVKTGEWFDLQRGQKIPKPETKNLNR